MKSIQALVAAVALAAVHLGAAAAPEISGTVTIKNNKATNVMAIGGKGSAGKALGGVVKAGEIEMNGVANVNSLVMNDKDAKVTGTVTISDNKAEGIKAIGGTANVNSVVMGK